MWIMISNTDKEDTMELKSKRYNDALEEALNFFGYRIERLKNPKTKLELKEMR